MLGQELSIHSALFVLNEDEFGTIHSTCERLYAAVRAAMLASSDGVVTILCWTDPITKKAVRHLLASLLAEENAPATHIRLCLLGTFYGIDYHALAYEFFLSNLESSQVSSRLSRTQQDETPHLVPAVLKDRLKFSILLPNEYLHESFPFDVCILVPVDSTLDIGLATSKHTKLGAPPHLEDMCGFEMCTRVSLSVESSMHFLQKKMRTSVSYCSIEDFFSQNSEQFCIRVNIEDVLPRIQSTMLVFKGDMAREACFMIVERHAGVAGFFLSLLTSRVQLLADVQSAASLSYFSAPWSRGACGDSSFVWTDYLAKKFIISECDARHCTLGNLLKEATGETTQRLTSLSEHLSVQDCTKWVENDIALRRRSIAEGFFGGVQAPEKGHRRRVLVFSPHPDDDVISMGAGLQALIREDVDLRMAYCVTGAVAVSDSFTRNYFSNSKNEKLFAEAFPAHSQSAVPDESSDSTSVLSLDTPKVGGVPHCLSWKLGVKILEVQKQFIREGEARTAVLSLDFAKYNDGEDGIHFLRLPFYGSGCGTRSEAGDADRDIVRALLERVRPDHIFLAGDLADPHGTHGQCYYAIKLALEQLYREEYARYKALAQSDARLGSLLYSSLNFVQARTLGSIQAFVEFVEKNRLPGMWLYRGAWNEFAVEAASLFLEMSAAEMKRKLVAIRHHTSQMGVAMFMGNDPRSFDERAYERNIQTAKKLSTLGIALGSGTVGVECFVHCVFLP